MWTRAVVTFSIFQDGGTAKIHYALCRTNINGEVLKSCTPKYVAVSLSNWQRGFVLIQWVIYPSKLEIYIYTVCKYSFYIHTRIFLYVCKEKIVFGHDHWYDWQKVLDMKLYVLTSTCTLQLAWHSFPECCYRQWILFAIKEPEVCRICKIQNSLSALHLS